jgi:hypothetical protein
MQEQPERTAPHPKDAELFDHIDRVLAEYDDQKKEGKK